MLSPFLPVVTGDYYALISTFKHDGIVSSTARIYRPGRLCQNVSEAEDVVLHHEDIRTEMWYNFAGVDRTNWIGGCGFHISLPLTIRMACSRLCSQTRRGVGNVVLMHPTNVQFLETLNVIDDGVTMGRWRHCGNLGESGREIRVYTSEECSTEEIFVAFQGDLDGSAIIFNKDGGCWLSMRDTDPSSSTPTSSYIIKIKVSHVAARN